MTEQEKEELRRKIEARKQREAAGTGTVNNNQQNWMRLCNPGKL